MIGSIFFCCNRDSIPEEDKFVQQTYIVVRTANDNADNVKTGINIKRLHAEMTSSNICRPAVFILTECFISYFTVDKIICQIMLEIIKNKALQLALWVINKDQIFFSQ